MPHSSLLFPTKKIVRVLSVVFLIASSCLVLYNIKNNKDQDVEVVEPFYSNAQESNAVEDPDDGRPTKFVSPLCKCDKEISVGPGGRAPDDGRFQWCSDESSFRGQHQKVISYSLYGNYSDDQVGKRYFPFLQNISLTASEQYPDWIVRIYHNFSSAYLKENAPVFKKLCHVFCHNPNVDLCSLHDMALRIGDAIVPIDPLLITGLNPKMYRFLAMIDPNVDVVVSRDIDSLIWPREVAAVREWLASNFTFHLMRDHTAHDAIMSAGMFGAKIHQRRDLIQGLTRTLIFSGQNQYVLHDQTALSEILWPIAKYDVMAHDSYFCEDQRIVNTSPLKVFPFPTKRDGNYFVGGVGPELFPEECPLACRPRDHLDWIQC